MSEQQPEYVWVFPPDKRRNRRRAWLIGILAVVAVAIAVALVWLLMPKGDPAPTPSPSDSASVSPTPTPSGSPSSTPTPTPTPTSTGGPVTPPPPADPDLPVFRGKVGPVLDDAGTGMKMLGGMSGQDAVQVVDQLQQDAQRLSDATAPKGIAQAWRDRVSSYSAALGKLRSAYQSGGGASGALDAVTSELAALRALVGA
ncbi:hypothetical protein [Microbacterium sp.]|uniref:hypothetical protein n=1 Tax=Microbacterium sp. TaxID=51671 RepID=UPI003342B831